MNKEEVTIKNSGATFTPTELADYLSQKILTYHDGNSKNCTILDPACGDGALLSSISKKISSNNFKLIGYETNLEYIINSKKNLSLILPESKFDIYNADFLEVAAPQTNDLFSTGIIQEFADIIIANPPYVRTQILGAEKSQAIARTFNLKGKIDLYYPFLIGMTNVLKKGGIIGVITSNRYLTTKSGADIRKFLLENYNIFEVIDLGDSKLFDAAVLPSILIAKKKSSKNSPSPSCYFAKLYEDISAERKKNTKKANSIYEILNKEEDGIYSIEDGRIFNFSIGKLKHSTIKTDIWQMTTNDENEWIETIKKNTKFYIGDKFKVRVGIKSCADNVFLNDNWDNEIDLPEDILLKQLISRENIVRWSSLKNKRFKVLYPHYSINGKRAVYNLSDFPKTERYLSKHKEQLEGRDYLIKAGKKWYELWVPQNPDLWKYPKLVFPDISIDALFSYDESGAIVNGNCYWIVAQNEEDKELLFLIQGVANSKLMDKYHDLCFNNKLYSERRRYLTQYVEKYPMPNPENEHSQRIIKIVKLLNKESAPIEELEGELNICVAKAFGFMD